MNKFIKFVLSTTVACSMVFSTMAFVGCQDKPDDNNPDNNNTQDEITISVNKSELTIEVGESQRLTAKVSDRSEVTWTSSDVSVATVSATGSVTGVKEGTATITATAKNGKTSECKVTVIKMVTRIELDITSKEMQEGENFTIAATVNDGTAVVWTSSNNEVATVENGVVTGVKAGTATITATAGEATATCAVAVFAKQAEDYKEVVFGEESKAVAAPGTIHYWNDQGWCGGFVTVSRSEWNQGKYWLSFSGNNAAWFGTQIFYKEPTNANGDMYKLTMNLNISVAGKITVNGEVIDVVAGDNAIEVTYQENADNASLSIQFGDKTNETPSMESAVCYLENWKWTPLASSKYNAPSNITLENNVITITDDNEGENKQYKIYMYDAEGNVAYTLTGGNTMTLNMESYENGTYTIKAQVLGNGNDVASSDISSTSVTYVVDNGDVSPIKYASEDEMMAGSIFDQFIYWAASWNGTNCTAKTIEGVATFDFTGNGADWWGLQIFYKDTSLTEGNKYTMTLNLNTTVAGKITVNGTVVELAVGDNAIEVEITQGDKASLSIQVGVNGDDSSRISAGVFKITNLKFTAVA